MEAQVERFAPGFRDLILARHVQSPADLERRNANLVAGDVGGGSYDLDQVVFRPVPGLSPYRTPAPRALSRQRIGVPRRCGARRAGPRGGADRAAGTAAAARLSAAMVSERDATRGPHA
jgi:phytoene dehydrogenase-like protein